ncbi:hypothetical protein OF83DRAFT_1173682 [Amylostereum chailletii]|nr:hypothetical protein OF83DRAFT_1173682 [Amylostereum chailletii]
MSDIDSYASIRVVNPTHAFANSVLTRYVGLAGFTIMVWDHIITFEDEYEYIWKGKKGPLIYLFFMNRYFIPLSFIVNIFAYFSHVWDIDPRRLCNRFVVYEGTMTMLGITISGLMMFLRIRALYHRQPLIQCFVFSILLAFVVVNSWLLTHAEPVFIQSPYIISCTMIFSPSIGPIAASSAWLPLLYDTVVVLLTLIRTVTSVWNRTAGTIVHVLLREGLAYYSVIFTVTLTLTIMIATADASVKNIVAQLELCLTVTMMSRITLDLKRFARGGSLAKQHSPADILHTNNVATGTWQSITRPSRLHTSGRGRVQHVERRTSGVEEDSFFAMVTQEEPPPERVQVQVDTTASARTEENIEMEVWEGLRASGGQV